MNLIEYLKLPYKHRGNGLDGADCYTIVKVFYKNEFGIDLPDLDYEVDWYTKNKNFISDMSNKIGFYSVDTAMPGDLLVLLSNKLPKHLGITLDQENFLHMTKLGPALHSYIAGVWSTKIFCILRYRGSSNDYKIRFRIN